MSYAVKDIIIGADGGGSGCRAAIATPDGAVIGRASAGPANVATDADLTIANLRTAIAGAAQEAGLDPAAISGAVAHIGLAGVMDYADSARVVAGLAMPHITVSNDCAISVAGALGEHDGALLAIGTGNIIAARHGDALRRVGGWGLQVSDQAAGAWLGRALLEHVLLCCDGMAEHSALTRDTLAGFDAGSGGGPEGTKGIVIFANAASPKDYGQFARAIADTAEAGDATGLLLMRRGADYLNRALDVLGLAGDDVLCLSGGLGPRYASYLTPAYRDRIAPSSGDALDGALRLARAAYERGGRNERR